MARWRSFGAAKCLETSKQDRRAKKEREGYLVISFVMKEYRIWVKGMSGYFTTYPKDQCVWLHVVWKRYMILNLHYECYCKYEHQEQLWKRTRGRVGLTERERTGLALLLRLLLLHWKNTHIILSLNIRLNVSQLAYRQVELKTY